MAPRTFPILILLTVVRAHLSYTLRRLRYNALTKALPITASFEKLLAECGPLQQKETELEDQIDDRIIEVAADDLDLNGFANRVSRTILTLTNGNREDALYTHFFGNKPLHVFTRPVLADQLDSMQKWSASLGSSPHPSLAALAPGLVPLLQAADGAIKAKASAEQKWSEFREVGERKDFIDRVNAARKEAYGILSTLPHKHVGLPARFADQFFRRDRSKPGEEVTIEGLEEELLALKAEIAEKEALRDQMKAAEEKAAKEAAAAEAAREAAKVELAALQKELAAKEQRASELAAVIRTNA